MGGFLAVTSISTHAYIMGRVIRRSKLDGGTGLGLQLHKLLLIVLLTTPENAPPSLATTTVGYCYRAYCPISASPDSRHRTWPTHGMMTSGKLQQPSLEVSGPYWKASYFCTIMQGCALRATTKKLCHRNNIELLRPSWPFQYGKTPNSLVSNIVARSVTIQLQFGHASVWRQHRCGCVWKGQ
jgi:hypothetical protein